MNLEQYHSKADTFARIGYIARAIVYFMMGGLALFVAIGQGGRTTDSKGALREFLEHPFGSVFLALLAGGLFCYALWRIYQAITDHGNDGTKPKGLLHRAGYVIGALGHASLGLYALNLIFHFQQSSGSTEKTMASKLLSLPGGRFITAAVAMIIIGFGISQFYIAIKEKFARNLAIPRDKRDFVMPICKFGLMARGFVFAIIGTFFVQAALKYSSQEAGGISKAWAVLRDQPYGDFLVAMVAAGFIAFGVYGVTEALYERTAKA